MEEKGEKEEKKGGGLGQERRKENWSNTMIQAGVGMERKDEGKGLMRSACDVSFGKGSLDNHTSKPVHKVINRDEKRSETSQKT